MAGREAAESALRRLPRIKPKLALVFGSSWFQQATLLQGVRAVLGTVPMVGESTAGEITPRGPTNRSCVVVLLASESLSCSIGVGERVDHSAREAGRQAALSAIREFQGSTRVGFLLFGDGMLVTNYADAVRGIQETLGTSSLIVGGMAGDDLRFAKTYQYYNARALNKSVVGALLGGNLKMGVGIEHGFAPISKPRRITRAYANVLYELDRQPAASVYEEYFGEDVVRRMRAEGLTRQGAAYPLGIQPETADRWLLRNVVSFGKDGSLACSGEIPEGAWLQLMIGNKELALDAAHDAARQAIQSLSRASCILLFDSAIRRKFLGTTHAAREIARIREVVGPQVPLAGCYTYAEQGPFGGSSGSYERTSIQTYSVLVVALGT